MTRNASTRALHDPALIAALIERVRVCAEDVRQPVVVGLSGLQGSGKSTLAARLVSACRAQSIDALAFSLDDAYLGRRDRQRLARTLHPLLSTRGVPGTHSPELVAHTFDRLARANRDAPARIPRFDKGIDTRLPPSRWRLVERAPQVIIFEGWCVGVPAQQETELRRAINRLEREEDGDGRWRAYVNTQLGGGYARLWTRLDLLIELKAPDFGVVTGWRAQQERALHGICAKRAMTRTELARFIAHFERISRHSLQTLSAIADVSIVLDDRRNVSALRMHAAPSARIAR